MSRKSAAPILLGGAAALAALLLATKDSFAKGGGSGGGGGGFGAPVPGGRRAAQQTAEERARTEWEAEQSATASDLAYLDQVLASAQGAGYPDELRAHAAALRAYEWETEVVAAEAYQAADQLDAEAAQMEDEAEAQEWRSWLQA